ncbi:MAG: hypothetical protein IPL81_15185 [Flavobacteriales bacterium]|nr:hypothetical protein [Flavobacteriales bacterium]
MKHIAAALLIACSLHASAQGLPSAPPSYQAKEIKGVQPDDLVAPAAFMAFGMLIAGNFATSTSWNQNEMAGPVLVLCAGVGALTIPLNVSARNKEAKRKRLAAL